MCMVMVPVLQVDVKIKSAKCAKAFDQCRVRAKCFINIRCP